MRRRGLDLLRSRQITRSHLVEAPKAASGAGIAWSLATLAHPSVPAVLRSDGGAGDRLANGL